MPQLPKGLKRALVLDVWAVLTILATTDVAPPVEKCIEETNHLI